LQVWGPLHAGYLDCIAGSFLFILPALVLTLSEALENVDWFGVGLLEYTDAAIIGADDNFPVLSNRAVADIDA